MFAGYRCVARIWQWAKNIFFTFGNWKFLCYMHSKVIPLLRSWRISENMLQLMHFSVYVVYILPENWPLLYRNNDIFALCTHAKIIRGHISLQENAQFVALSNLWSMFNSFCVL